MSIQNRYLIVFENGLLQGISLTDERGVPMPLELADLEAVLPDINAAALARLSVIDAEHAEEIAALNETHAAVFNPLKSLYEEMIVKVPLVLNSGDPAQYEALATAFITPAREKELQAIDAEIAALQAKRDALNPPTP